MREIQVKLAKAHKIQEKNFDVQRELKSIQEYLNQTEIKLPYDAICLMCLRGSYDDFSKNTNTAFLFINCMRRPINEIHGVITMHADEKGIQFARATVDFDEPFMGTLSDREALLVHLNVPTRGVSEDRIFKNTELEVEFTDTRVTYVN